MHDDDRGHPRFRHLVDHRDGMLSERRRREVDAHLGSGCAQCANTLAEVHEMLDDLASPALVAPPAAAVRRARRLWVAGGVRRVLERVLATLVFDERVMPAMALRSAVGSARRALYLAGEVEIYVELSRAEHGWTLMGEFAPSGGGDDVLSGVVFVRMRDRVLARVDLDAQGAFVVEGLADGPIRIEGRVAGRWIDLPPIAMS